MRKKTSDSKFFSAAMKLADLIDINYRLLGVLSRVGIGFGFGDETVAEACAHSHVNVNTFLLICNVYTFEGYRPGPDRLEETDLRDVVKYLHSSHAYYMGVAVQNLANAISRAIAPCDEPRKRVIWKFFAEYKEELARHFEYEENTVFPYVESVLTHRAEDGFTILQYEENHSNIEEKLDDLKNIVMKYLPQECDDNEILTVLVHLYALGEDLAKHTFIEDEILVPVVNQLEHHE